MGKGGRMIKRERALRALKRKYIDAYEIDIKVQNKHLFYTPRDRYGNAMQRTREVLIEDILEIEKAVREENRIIKKGRETAWKIKEEMWIAENRKWRKRSIIQTTIIIALVWIGIIAGVIIYYKLL